MNRVKLELRRAKGWLAFRLVMATAFAPDWVWWWALPAAGLYAHYDCDRSNWSLPA